MKAQTRQVHLCMCKMWTCHLELTESHSVARCAMRSYCYGSNYLRLYDKRLVRDKQYATSEIAYYKKFVKTHNYYCS